MKCLIVSGFQDLWEQLTYDVMMQNGLLPMITRYHVECLPVAAADLAT